MSNQGERVVLITGGTGGLGSVVAPAFAHAGWRVALTDLDRSSLAAHTPRLRAGATPRALVSRRMDVLDPESAGQLVHLVMDVHGRLDALLNLVGGFAAGTRVGDLESLEVWEKMWRLNVFSAVNMCRAAIPSLRANGWGRIVNVGSRNALKGTAQSAAYSASKAAVVNLTEALAAEEKHNHINVNVILPGTIDTPGNRKAMPNADFDRWVSPRQIADTLLFLCSGAADAITGATIAVYNRS